jgi:hypothetical protein
MGHIGAPSELGAIFKWAGAHLKNDFYSSIAGFDFILVLENFS